MEVTRADVSGNTRAAQRAASGTTGYRPGVGVTPDFRLDPNFKPKPQASVGSAPKPPTVTAPAAGMGARVLPALGRAAVGAVARHPVGAAAVLTGLGAYGAYKLATSMNKKNTGVKEQLTPGTSYIPKDVKQPHIDTRNPGQKLKDLQDRIKYYGGYPPKGPV
jgi:hypothetical protein